MSIFIDTQSFRKAKFYCDSNGIILRTVMDNNSVGWCIGEHISDLFLSKISLPNSQHTDLFQGLMRLNSSRSIETVFTEVSQFDSNIIVEISIIHNTKSYFFDHNKQVSNEIKGLKWVESHLKEEVSNFKYVENFSKVGYWTYHITENSMTWSDGLYSLIGIEKKVFYYELDEVFNLIHSSDTHLFKQRYEDHIQTHNDFQMILTVEDDQTNTSKKLEFKATIIRDTTSAEPISFMVIQDVTTFLSAKANLQRNQTILKKLSDNISEVLIVFSLPNYTPTYISKSYEKLMGKRKESDSLDTSILAGVSSSDKKQLINILEKASNGEKCSIEYKYQNPTTQAEQFHRMSVVPIQENGDSIQNIAAVISDISVYKRADLLEKNQRDELRKVDKMKSLASLVSGVAHEINNPNNLIMLNCTFLMKVWDEIIPILDEKEKISGKLKLHNLPYDEIRDEFAELLGSILHGSDRIKSIVASLRKFVLADNSSITSSVNINGVINRVVEISNNKLKKSSSKCDLHLDNISTAITANESQIQQLFLNILNNACEAATKDGQVIIIETAVSSNDRIIVTIEDSGCGIPDCDLENIFEPFFTTKRNIQCEGLGLAVSYGIVEQHNGTISVESVYGSGTKIIIELPISHQH